MLCQNCGENEANVRYTQIVNGVKKQMSLCDKCAKRLGIEDANFNIPINFSNFLGDMLDMYDDTIPSFMNLKTLTCDKSNIDYVNNVEYVGSSNTAFETKMDSLLKNTHIPNRYNEKAKTQLEKLKERLEIEVKEERYEDAAKTRDEIKKLSNSK